jgi:hypothetical protein
MYASGSFGLVDRLYKPADPPSTNGAPEPCARDTKVISLPSGSLPTTLHNPVFGFLIDVFFVTFMIVLFGEVIPKIYAVQNNSKVSAWVAVFMFYMYKLFRPLVFVLENSTSIIDKRVTKRGHILSVDELSHAIDITTESDSPKQEKSILKGIVNFVNTNVTEIMCQRPDIAAIDIETNFTELLQQIDEHLPLAQISNLASPALMARIYIATNGNFDYLMKLLSHSLKRAVESGSESLSMEQLEKGFDDLHQIPARNGNPFSGSFNGSVLDQRGQVFHQQSDVDLLEAEKSKLGVCA